jgi:cytidylate kinase
MKNIIIAIDGPAGSGKSTIAKLIAKKHSLTYLDTGAMYRMVAFFSLENNVDLNDELSVKKMMEEIRLDINNEQFMVNNKDVSKEIRTPEITRIVSKIASIKQIRENLVQLQREIAKGKNSILDGRDIGTVVFPNADLKIFLIASPEERAKRRMKDYEMKGINEESYEEVLSALKHRDHIDMTREESPLKKAENSIEIDSSNLSIVEICDEISKYILKLGE